MARLYRYTYIIAVCFGLNGRFFRHTAPDILHILSYLGLFRLFIGPFDGFGTRGVAVPCFRIDFTQNASQNVIVIDLGHRLLLLRSCISKEAANRCVTIRSWLGDITQLLFTFNLFSLSFAPSALLFFTFFVFIKYLTAIFDIVRRICTTKAQKYSL